MIMILIIILILITIMIPIHDNDDQDVTDEAGWPLAWDAADAFFSPGKVEVPFFCCHRKHHC